jgi:glucose-6-phosphate isomerase
MTAKRPNPLSFDLSLAVAGKGAPSKAAYEASLAAAVGALSWLRQQAADKSLELLGVPARTDDIRKAQARAKEIAGFSKTVAVLGIGGSSLGGQALTSLRKNAVPFVEFHDNPDPFSWTAALKRFDLKKTHFIAISKSGGTAEVMVQVLTAVEALKKRGVKNIGKHFTIITEPHGSALASFADSIGAPKLDHPLGVGGRYSVLTMVGLLPAILMGLDVKQLRAGAAAVLEQALAGKTSADSPAATGAALHYALAQESKLDSTVLWPYADSLAVFGGWWKQLWAESLGKDGQGSTPVSVLGPVDQHSQLQLFRDGPGKALFTLVTIDMKGHGPAVPRAVAKALGQDYLAGKRPGDLIAAQSRGTAQTLFKNGRPVRMMHVSKVDAFSMGALMMHFMLETILMGRLMGVDPFDQPGVEEAKILSKQYLAEG